MSMMASHKPQFCQVLLGSRTCHGSPLPLDESPSSVAGLSKPSPVSPLLPSPSSLGQAWSGPAWSGHWAVRQEEEMQGWEK